MHRGAVAVGGAFGACARALVDAGVPGPAPLGTLLVNCSGSLLLGLLLARTQDPRWRAGIGTGVLGSWTTFSTLALELEGLLRDDPLLAVVYAAVTVVLGLAAVAAGTHLGARLAARSTPT